MGNIKKLDKSVYNRIAAGEVIENPASVVKELVENSIDAGAMHINVKIEEGGLKYISVADNGCGIQYDDFPMAITAHATSKIKTVKDLEYAATLGFRGEALASIASVSKFELRSRFISEHDSYYMTVEGGEIIAKGKCASVVGTKISVSSLFYNTPARYKFLKPPKGEETNVTRLMIELMLANAGLAFKYYVDGELRLFTDGKGLDSALINIFGDEIFDNLIPFKLDEKNYRVNGFIGRPTSNAIIGNKSKQIYMVNGRIFEDQTLPAVIQNAYGERLMKRTFPIAVVEIISPFDLVDVNVHPGKKEVRFAEKKIVWGIVYSAIKYAIEKDEYEREEELKFQMSLTPEKKEKMANLLKTLTTRHLTDEEIEENRGLLDGCCIDLRGKLPRIKKIIDKFEPNDGRVKDTEYTGQIVRDSRNDLVPEKNPLPAPHIAAKLAHMSGDVSLFRLDEKPEAFEVVYRDEAEKDMPELRDLPIYTREELMLAEDALDRPRYRMLGQLFDTYLIIECARNLCFIDQHAVHERILYDKMIAAMKEKILVQSFFTPIVRNVDKSDGDVIDMCTKSLAKIGFDIRVTYHNSRVEIYSIPSIVAEMDIDYFLHSLVEEGKEIESLTEMKQIKERLAMMACRSAIKAGERLSVDQIAYIMDYFIENGMPLQCSHGRPTIVHYKKSDVDKWFKRRV